MAGIYRAAFLAGLAAAGWPAPAMASDQPAAVEMADSALLAAALGGPQLELTMRGTSVTVIGRAVPAENGCAAQLTASAAAGGGQRHARLFRWDDLAWAGEDPRRSSETGGAGATLVSFYEHEGRLAGDQLAFTPADGAGFRAALARVSAACRAARRADERVLTPSTAAARSCYFAQMPQLQLYEPSATGANAEPPRAMLTLLARDNPAAELQVLLEREPGPEASGHPGVAFIFADPRLSEMRIAAAAFAVDAQPVAAPHSIAVFGDTRARIAIEPPRAPAGDAQQAELYRQLAGGGEARLTLLDETRTVQATMHFTAGPALAAAQQALAASDWSCADAAAPPRPAAHWALAD